MILFSADWHIKLGQKNVPVSWAKARYREFFKQLHKIEMQAELHIIGGDIFDRIPSMEELQIFCEYIKGIKIPTLIFDGNHEATRKNQTFFSQLKIIVESINSNVSVILEPFEDDELQFSILPYCHLHRKDSIEKLNPKFPLFTHVRGEIPPHVTPEVDLERFSKFPIVFAGDLHSHDNCQKNIVYPGSPMTTSFHRSKVETGVLMILENYDWYWERLALPQLIRKTVSSEKDMTPGTYDHVIYELQGDLADLADIKANDLLDKKVVKRSSEASLILDKDMSIGEELTEYLTYVLELPEEKVNSILGTFNDYAKEVEVG